MDQFTEIRTWAEISRSALRHNLNVAKELTGGTKIMCVIKGNAHGHGAVECGRTLEQAGADAFAVASLEEAVELRTAGIKVPILVLGWTDPRQASVFCDYDILQSGLDLEYVRELSEQMTAQKESRSIGIHVKLDTGMTRTGVNAQEDPGAAAEAVKTMMALPGIQVTGIFTHFAAADMPEKDDYTAMQLERYKTVLAELEKRGIDTTKLLKHTGNSASIMYHPETIFDMMREGVMMYGFYPNGIYDPDGPLEPVLSLNCRVAQVKEIPAGTSVSYGCTFTSDSPMKIAAVTGSVGGDQRTEMPADRKDLHGYVHVRCHGKRCKGWGPSDPVWKRRDASGRAHGSDRDHQLRAHVPHHEPGQKNLCGLNRKVYL